MLVEILSISFPSLSTQVKASDNRIMSDSIGFPCNSCRIWTWFDQIQYRSVEILALGNRSEFILNPTKNRQQKRIFLSVFCRIQDKFRSVSERRDSDSGWQNSVGLKTIRQYTMAHLRPGNISREGFLCIKKLSRVRFVSATNRIRTLWASNVGVVA